MYDYLQDNLTSDMKCYFRITVVHLSFRQLRVHDGISSRLTIFKTKKQISKQKRKDEYKFYLAKVSSRFWSVSKFLDELTKEILPLVSILDLDSVN